MVAKAKYPKPPKRLPFLEAICWQTADVMDLTQKEMLYRYERGWDYRGILGDLDVEERLFIKELAQFYGSWLASDV